MAGSEHADSLTFNPHKMLGVPLTCSFLLTSDLRKFKKANSIPASYLFHEADSLTSDDSDHDHSGESYSQSQHQTGYVNGSDIFNITSSPSREAGRGHHPSTHPAFNDPTTDRAASDFGPMDDLGDLALQCGRKGDSFKLFLGWLYYGTAYYGQRIDEAFSTAAYPASLVAAHPQLTLLGEYPPTCLQVCFYYGANKTIGGGCGQGQGQGQGQGEGEGQGKKEKKAVESSPEWNTWVTKAIAKGLVDRGFMVDYAPGQEGGGGMFLRVVVHLSVRRETVERLVAEVVSVGDMLMEESPCC